MSTSIQKHPFPGIGTFWIKPSCPAPTVAQVLDVRSHDMTVLIKAGRQKAWWPLDRFLSEFSRFPS